MKKIITTTKKPILLPYKNSYFQLLKFILTTHYWRGWPCFFEISGGVTF